MNGHCYFIMSIAPQWNVMFALLRMHMEILQKSLNLGGGSSITSQLQIFFRLDYSGWYSRNLFDSVFWGALAFCIVVCALTFLLNITWILTRKSILWWIQRFAF